MVRVDERTNPVEGRVVWSPIKSLWFTTHALIALVAGYATFSWEAGLTACVATIVTLCCGQSLGLHRLLIHRSFACPRWLEYLFVHLGTVVGMNGPFGMMAMHEIRDWSQRHPRCHAFFIHRASWWRDCYRQLHCEIHLDHPPCFVIEPEIAGDGLYRFLQRTWMSQQLPWAILFYLLGGWAFVVWGISVRITVSLLGHWLVGYLAHNHGQREWELAGHAVQGYNVPYFGLWSMGEAWHNNHHAFPGSARFGLHENQHDPGWWMLCALKRIGLIWDVKLPEDLPERTELRHLGGDTIISENAAA
ncbi:MAG: acyl-CoA desaturase [Pirellulales bacterium]